VRKSSAPSPSNATFGVKPSDVSSTSVRTIRGLELDSSTSKRTLKAPRFAARGDRRRRR
jgi:hypothetical protein